ncbi:mucin-20 [Erinaceus europaeus]|uniref:Mucin-20 n=1 Tax=Erinaceus europaeus TaxID=9365 RepID=A0ABM3VRP1_ERIEU|nr:mucin-20 [Erinaceus europaeus]
MGRLWSLALALLCFCWGSGAPPSSVGPRTHPRGPQVTGQDPDPQTQPPGLKSSSERGIHTTIPAAERGVHTATQAEACPSGLLLPGWAPVGSQAKVGARAAKLLPGTEATPGAPAGVTTTGTVTGWGLWVTASASLWAGDSSVEVLGISVVHVSAGAEGEASEDSAPRSGDSAPPSGVSAPPSGVSASPSEDGVSPSGVSAPPSGVSASPSEESAPPSEDSAPPSGVSAPPSGVSASPSEDGVSPSGVSAPPSGVSASPSEDGAPPSGVSAPPSGVGVRPSGFCAPRSSSAAALPGGGGEGGGPPAPESPVPPDSSAPPASATGRPHGSVTARTPRTPVTGPEGRPPRVPAGAEGEGGFLLLRLRVASPKDLTDPRMAEGLLLQLRRHLHVMVPPVHVSLLRVGSA